MGACDDWVSFKCKRNELADQFKAHQEMLAYEHGHSYSGMLNMCTGLDIHNETFENRAKAEEYISSKFEKWGDAIAVQYTNKSNDVVWLIGGLCSS